MLSFQFNCMKKMIKLLPLIILFFCFSQVSTAQNPQDIVGKWKTIDDNSGEARSIVEIYKKGDKYYGQISSIFSEPGEDPDPICDICPSDRKDQKVIGMEIIRDLVFEDGEYVSGNILDPDNGKVYKCKLWIEDGELQVRGYVTIFFRTQTWYRP